MSLFVLCYGEYRGKKTVKLFMRYVSSRLRMYAQEHTYRIYVTDALKSFMGLNVRYADNFAPQEKRSAEEIINSIAKKLGGEADGRI